MMKPSIQKSFEDGVLTLTIANEDKRNAFTPEMARDLGEALNAADQNVAVRCIVLTGAGDIAFSSGHDLGSMLDDREHASDPALNHPFLLPAQLDTPTIAAINGHAYAAGFILAISCDLRVCTENSSFCAPGAHIGLLPIGGQLSRLPRLMPQGIAQELLMTGRPMSAEEAFRIGFANRLVPRGSAVIAAREIAAAIVGNSSGVVRSIKKGVRMLSEQGAAATEAFEWTESKELQTAPDAQEGMKAFLEKRKPRFH